LLSLFIAPCWEKICSACSSRACMEKPSMTHALPANTGALPEWVWHGEGRTTSSLCVAAVPCLPGWRIEWRSSSHQGREGSTVHKSGWAWRWRWRWRFARQAKLHWSNGTWGSILDHHRIKIPALLRSRRCSITKNTGWQLLYNLGLFVTTPSPPFTNKCTSNLKFTNKCTSNLKSTNVHLDFLVY
jgi:hypothetical protein